MRFRPALLLLAFTAVLPAAAQTRPAKGAKSATPAVPLEEQIEALKAGQAQMMRELGEIKAMLKNGAKADAGAPQPQAHVVANVFGEPFRGDAKARVAILEYSDFDCPFCGRYSREIYPRLDADYVKTGKIKYFFRDLPLPDHPQAGYKANLARVAGEQGKFWEAHDWLFAHQTPMDDKGLGLFAQALGLDRAKLDAGVKEDRYASAIQRSMVTAEHMQISGTPAFLIGTLSPDGQVFTATKVFMGAQSYDGFKEILDGLLGPQASPSPAAAPASKSAAVAVPPAAPAAADPSTCGS